MIRGVILVIIDCFFLYIRDNLSEGGSSMEKEKFAKKLIRLRKRKGYTQQELADKLQVTNKAISRWETGEGFPDIALLVPLCDALGVNCDDLLREEKDYKDIQKDDIQQYLPFIVSVSSIIIFYLLQALKVPMLIIFALLCISMIFSFYLMLHHTNKKHFSLLTKFNVILSYFPIVSCINSGLMMFYMINLFGFQGFFIQETSDYFQSSSNGMEGGLGVFSDFLFLLVIGYVLAFIICIILYIILEKLFRKRYEICEERVKKNERVFSIVKKIGDISTACTILLVFGLLYYWYNKLQIPIDTSNMYLLDYMNDTVVKIKVYLLLSILPAILYHIIVLVIYQKQWSFIRNLLILIVYLGAIIILTYVDGIYLTSPILFIGIGAVLIVAELAYEVMRYKKRNKTV